MFDVEIVLCSRCVHCHKKNRDCVAGGWDSCKGKKFTTEEMQTIRDKVEEYRTTIESLEDELANIRRQLRNETSDL